MLSLSSIRCRRYTSTLFLLSVGHQWAKLSDEITLVNLFRKLLTSKQQNLMDYFPRDCRCKTDT